MFGLDPPVRVPGVQGHVATSNGVPSWPRQTGRSVEVHEDNLTAGFGAAVAATIAKEAFWQFDAPVDRIAVEDVPMPHHPVLLEAAPPTVELIRSPIEATLAT
ncbi:MAG: hypothetical protein H0X34_14695 [Chthoniobacterales bacterium]|nr:hypothetical protein [Gemmatimonadaceae bacterium]MBA3833111.1 hypothetical protein [Chthoniobacterales bacterium]